jgi:hypothetical protein
MIVTELYIEPFLETIEDKRKKDVIEIIGLIQSLFECLPKLWGSIIGFGQLKYRYDSGHTGIMPVIGLASRKKAITLYLGYDLAKYDLSLLGQVQIGKGCLYIKSLESIDKKALLSLLKQAKEEMLNQRVITEIIEL